MAKKKLPLVAICGRPNVGKSTLFNRMIGRQTAIIHDEEGITRDRAIGTATWEGRSFRVVDTGGIVENPLDPITQKMQEQIRLAMNEARVIVFVVDGQQELTRVDEEIRDELYRYGKPVVLAVNKLDNATLELNRTDFYAMGMGEPYAISSGHGLGMDLLFDAVLEHLPKPAEGDVAEEEEEEPEKKELIKVAIIGKPNVGKSSFVNAILNEERTIVSEIPGTTRDAIDIEYTWKDTDYLLIDTAGLRKKAGIKRHVEHFSVARSLRAIRRSHVCMVLIDAMDGVTEQDKRILGYVLENGKAFALVFTKWDLVEDKAARLKELQEELDFKAGFVERYAPILTISNLTRQRLFKTFDLMKKLYNEGGQRIATAELNKLVEDIKTRHTPPSIKGKRAKILYATQTGIRPTEFVLFVNQKRLFHFSYVRFIENCIREKYSFEGVPIKLELREEKTKRTESEKKKPKAKAGATPKKPSAKKS